MSLEELIKIAAEPHLIVSAKEANLLLARLQAEISHLRLEVSELELKADLYLNELFNGEMAIEKTKALWRVSDVYREWKTKAGLLTDVRSVRRNLERHTDLLLSQEKFNPRSYPRVIE